MNATRFGAANREPSSRSSKTKSGTVRSAFAAAASAGLSWTRRSRLKRTSAVSICIWSRNGKRIRRGEGSAPARGRPSRPRARPARTGIGARRDRGGTPRPQPRRAAAGAAGGPSRRPGSLRLPARGPVPAELHENHRLPEGRLLRDLDLHRDLRGDADLADRLPPAHLPLPAEAPARLLLEPVLDHRPRLPRAGDDRGD